MRISKRQLRRIIREETVGVEDVSKTSDAFGGGEVIEEPFVDVDEDELLNVNGDPGNVRDILVIPENRILKVTKSLLRRIIKEEKRRLLYEQEMGGQEKVDPRKHQWPSADDAIDGVADELSLSWHDMEISSWSAGDPSMNKSGELSDAESKEWWAEQVEVATAELESTMSAELRNASIAVMEEFTEKLINGEYS